MFSLFYNIFSLVVLVYCTIILIKDFQYKKQNLIARNDNAMQPTSIYHNAFADYDEKYIENNPNLSYDWCRISKRKDLSLSFLHKMRDHLNWFYVLSNNTLPESFLKDNIEVITKDGDNWDTLFITQKVGETFISTFQQEIPLKVWDNISEYQKLSETFIDRNKDNLSLRSISANSELSELFIRRNIMTLDLISIVKFQKLPEIFIEDFIDKLNMEHVCRYQKLSESFMRYHEDIIRWDIISKTQKLSEEFINEFRDRLNWDLVSSHQDLSKNFIKNNVDHLNLHRLRENTCLSLDAMVYVNDLTCAFRFAFHFLWKAIKSLDVENDCR